MKFVLHYIAEYKWYAILAPLFKMLEAIFELLVPLVVAAMIDRGIINHDKRFVILMGLLLLLLAVVGMAVSITAQYFAARAAVLSTGRMRSDVYKRIMSFSQNSLDRVGTSALLTRITSDLNQVQGGINMTLRLFLRSPFVVAGAMIMAALISLRAFVLFAAVILCLSVFVAWLMRHTLPMYNTVQKKLEGLMVLVRENLEGIRVIRAFTGEEQERKAFFSRNEGLYEVAMTAGGWQSMLNPVTFVMVNFAVVILLYYSGRAVYVGSLTTGETVALYNYMCQILVELVKFATLIVQITRAWACVGRVSDLMSMVPDERVQHNPAEATASAAANAAPEAPAIRFRSVNFSYPSNNKPKAPTPDSDQSSARKAINDLSFSVAAGEMLGIIGGTGSGKSTIGGLLRHAYDINDGSIELFGRPVNEMTDASIAGICAYVPQRSQLFTGTVEDNLRLGAREASRDDLINSLKIAQAYDFVMEKGGLAASVAKGGTNFSGGQRQRLCIARALAAASRILVLDDATSALDAATERQLISELKSIKDLTIIVIAQRTMSVQSADNIIVMDSGWCVESGIHEELLKHNSTYCEIYEAGL